jgi:drug/metabolite transporter (DMT)-like permease
MKIPPQAIVAAIVIHTLWGANPVAVKFGLEVFPPLWSGFLRFVLALICIYCWARFKKIRLTPSRDEWRPLAVLATIFWIQIWAMNAGFELSSGAVSSVLLATHPLFAALFAHFMIETDRLTPMRTLGLAIAFSGTALIMLRGGGLSAADFSMFGGSVVVFSSMLLGFRLIMAGRMVRKMDPIRVIFWQMGLALTPFLIAALILEDIAWDTLAWEPVAGIAYQGIVVAGLGFTVSFELMKRYSPATMVSFGFIAPISGVGLSIWLLGDAVTWTIAIGTACVGLGLILITRRGRAA